MHGLLLVVPSLVVEHRLEHRLSRRDSRAVAALRYVGPSWDPGSNRVSCTGRRILLPLTTREALVRTFLISVGESVV